MFWAGVIEENGRIEEEEQAGTNLGKKQVNEENVNVGEVTDLQPEKIKD